MFDFIHWLTCKYREVHLLRPPRPLLHNSEPWIAGRRMRKLHHEAWMEQWSHLSVPTPGPKDVTIGLLSQAVNLVYVLGQSDTGEPTLACSRCGQVMATLPIGSLTPLTIPSQPGS